MNQYSITGMHCEACATLIQMELDDAGFDTVKVNQAKHLIEVPKKLTGRLEDIRAAVQEAGDYDITKL